MKVAVIGAGSSYTPELVGGFLTRQTQLPLNELVLMDLDPVKLGVVGGLAGRMLTQAGHRARLSLTENLDEALRGADFVLTQFRVGKLDARILDEKIPLGFDLIGQETTGIGGLFKALRTIPVIETISQRMEVLCPRALLVNFTNPSGIVTQYLATHSPVRAVGLCNVPINMHHDLARILGKPVTELELDYVGLNHLSWVTAARHQGTDLLPGLIDSGYQGATMKNIPGIEVDPLVLHTAGGLPSSYLNYFYYRDKQLAMLKQAKLSRGEECQSVEAQLLEIYARPTTVAAPPELEQRGGHLYSEVAVSLIDAVWNNTGAENVVDLRNDATSHPSGRILDFLEPDDVIEAPALVSRERFKGRPPLHRPNHHVMGLVQAVKAFERLAVEAAVRGDRDAAMQALLVNPLVGDWDRATACFDALLKAHRVWLPRFFGKT
ncbi:MAG: 6-phospho-beta-glucosidase [Spirochaetales bacterium]